MSNYTESIVDCGSISISFGDWYNEHNLKIKFSVGRIYIKN